MAAKFNVKPENIIKRAEELVNVGQSMAALQVMHEAMVSKRYRVFTESHETLMMRFLELCVDLRKGKLAKEALHAFKNLTLTVAISSLENVAKNFLKLSEAKVAAAQEQAERILESVEDLEEDAETPESIMLKSVSGQDNKDRTDREVVTPWFKFLWETYRTVLDVTKNNSKLEPLYHSAAHQAFEFCQKYGRKMELRRLCELLRNHLISLPKYSHQAYAINLNSAESMQMHLETRFLQLNTASSLELWQEAFRSIEDIHGLVQLSRKPPKAALMVNYYEQLSKIFLVSGNLLFHAISLCKHFALANRDPSKYTAEEMKRVANAVLLSALAIPLEQRAGGASLLESMEEASFRNQKLVDILGLVRMPSRQELLDDAVDRGLLKIVDPVFAKLYAVLEKKFTLQQSAKAVGDLIAQFAEDADYKKYVSPISYVALSQVMRKVSQVYSAVNFETLLALFGTSCAFAFKRHEIENFIIKSCARGELQAYIDHVTDSVCFKAKLSSVGGGVGQLGVLGAKLFAITNSISRGGREKQHSKPQSFIDLIEAERRENLARKFKIDQKKELLEQLAVEREKALAKERALRAQEEAEAEKIRLTEEANRREAERRKREKEEIDRRQMLKLAEEMKKKNLKLEIESMEALDKEKLKRIQIEQLETERKELESRMKTLAKRLDHLERAYRKEEAPVLEIAFRDKKAQDEAHHHSAYKMLLDATKRQYLTNLEGKKRMCRMMEHMQTYKASIQQTKAEAFEKLKEEMEAKKNKEKQARFVKVKTEKERELLEKERMEQERLEAERERQIREQKEAEMKAQAEAEREKERKISDERLRLQLQREKEAEENLRRRELERKQRQESTAAATRPSSSGGLDWSSVRGSRAASSEQSTTAAATAAYQPQRYVPPSRKKVESEEENIPPVAATDKPAAAAPAAKFVPSAARRKDDSKPSTGGAFKSWRNGASSSADNGNAADGDASGWQTVSKRK